MAGRSKGQKNMVTRIRNQILRSRGLTRVPGGGLRRTFGPPPKQNQKPILELENPKAYNKTTRMIALELAFNRHIDELLMAGTVGDVALVLGLKPQTVSKWRGMRGLSQPVNGSGAPKRVDQVLDSPGLAITGTEGA